MDVRALNALTGGYNATVAAAVPVDTRALISEIATTTSLSDGERSGLISAIAKVDQNLIGASRATVLEQVQNLGIYLRNTSVNESFPRWSMMTALRAYGMNLQEKSPEPAVTASKILSQLDQIAQASRGVSLETAVAVAARPAPLPVVAVDNAETAPVDDGPRIEKIA